MVFTLIFLFLFFVPYFSRALYWTFQTISQKSFLQLHSSVVSLPEDVSPGVEMSANYSALLDCNVGNNAKDSPEDSINKYSKRCTEVRVGALLIGADQGPYKWLLAVLLIVFNFFKALLTWRVSLMRDAEDRSGCTPNWGPRLLSRPIPPKTLDEYFPNRLQKLRQKLSRARNVFERSWWKNYFSGYRLDFYLHKLVTILFAFSLVAFFYNAWFWLWKTKVLVLL
jgi:hypothetical protein